MRRRATGSTKPSSTPPARRDYSRWRAASLIAVYLLMAAHIVHWKLAGRTLAPLELNEVMYTLELGIITAGFLFMVGVMMATLIFGRFFCSWGCHILALQDLCAWILQKLRIRPKAIRSRVLFLVPALAAGYMFVWPQIVRLWRGRPLPILHFRTDSEGWASFLTEDYWRNLPGPGIALLTFAIVGFFIVYVLGSRSFCAYGCPYGAVFGVLDRFAPGRIRLKPNRSCGDCGRCTAVCSSHVRVHEEIARHGMIVNSRCLKDLDCIAACPDQSLYYGFGRPGVAKPIREPIEIERRYDFSLAEEVIVACAMVATLLIFRGLYDRVPFLMSLGLGAIVSYMCVLAWRLVRYPEVKFQRVCLKNPRGMTTAGWIFVVLMTCFGAFAGHSAFVRYHTWSGRRAYHEALASSDANARWIERSLAQLGTATRWSPFYMPENDRMVGDLLVRESRWIEAATVYERLLRHLPGHREARLGLGLSLARQNRHLEAVRLLRDGVNMLGRDPQLLYDLAGSLHALGRLNEAITELRNAVLAKPDFARAHADLGVCLLEISDTRGALQHLSRAVELNPASADAHYNLALAHWSVGAYDDARRAISKAFELNPTDEQTIRLHQIMMPKSRE